MRKEDGVQLHQEFNYVPNQEAVLLQQALGLRVEKRPLKVGLDFRTRLQLVLKQATLSSRLLEAGVALLTRPKGMYDPSLNIVFSNGKIEDDLFLSAQAWIHQVNPEIDEATEAIEASLEEKEAFSIEDLERAVCYLYFRDGLASWMMMETLMHLEREKDQEVGGSGKTQVFMMGEEAKDVFEKSQDTITSAFSQLRTAVEDFRVGLQSTGMARSRSFFKASRAVLKVKDDAGFYFCFQATDQLIAGGTSLNEALKLMAQNPPQELFYLQNPQEYVSLFLLSSEDGLSEKTADETSPSWTTT